MIKDENIEKIINGEMFLKSHHKLSDFNQNQIKRLREVFSKSKYLSVPECCIWLGVCRRTLYSMIKKGNISYFRVTCSKQAPYKIDVEKTKRILKKKQKI